MSHRLVVSCLACLALAAVHAPASAAARPHEDGYLRCVARERAAPVRDTAPLAALLRLERHAICFRLHWPTRAAIPAAVEAPPVDACAAPSSRRARRWREAWEQQGAQLRSAAERARQDALEARALGRAFTDDHAADAVRVATDLEAQSRTLQQYVDRLWPAWPNGAGAACPPDAMRLSPPRAPSR